jgi:hypothetical protein
VFELNGETFAGGSMAQSKDLLNEEENRPVNLDGEAQAPATGNTIPRNVVYKATTLNGQ